MAFTNSGPIKRGLVRRVRSLSSLTNALVGGIHQRVAPRKIAYPYLVYDEVSAPMFDDSGTGPAGGREIRALYDLTIYATNAVEAENLGQLVYTLFDGADKELDLLVDGQRVTLCRIVGTLPDNGPERDDTGAYYAQIGHTIEVWTQQNG